MRGLRSLLEDFIILTLWVFAILIMDVESLVIYVLILLFLRRRSKAMMRLIMFVVAWTFFVRMLLIISNMYENLNPMEYPSSLSTKGGEHTDIFDFGKKDYIIPWLDFVVNSDTDFSKTYWLALLPSS